MADATTMGTSIANEITAAEAILVGTETSAQVRLAMMIALASGVLPNIESSALSSKLTTGEGAGTGSYYGLLARVTISAQLQYASLALAVNGAKDAGLAHAWAVLQLKVKQAAALGSAPIVDLDLVVAKTFATASFVAITTVNTGSQTVVELWGQAPAADVPLGYAAINLHGTATIDLEPGALQAALPAGVQTPAVTADPLPHPHLWSDITNPPTTFPASPHTHPWSDLASGIPDTASRWPTWTEVTSKPADFPAAAHTHPVAEVSDATTVGQNLVKLTNPSAITFLRVDAANTITPRSAANFKTDLALNLVENTALSTWAGTASITAIGTLASGAVPWSLVTGAPATFPASAHTHVKADITDFAHTHGNISNAGAIGTTADLVAVTGASGVLTTASRSGIDSRSTFPPDSHTHGNISNAGAIGTTSNLVVTTTTSGVLTTLSRSGIDSRSTFPPDTHSHTIAWTAGTTAGPTLSVAGGAAVAIPVAANAASGVVTAAAQTLGGVKTFSSNVTTTADLVMASSGGELRNSVATGYTRLSGGTAGNGANVLLYGASHSTLASRGHLRAGGTNRIMWNSTGVYIYGQLIIPVV